MNLDTQLTWERKAQAAGLVSLFCFVLFFSDSHSTRHRLIQANHGKDSGRSEVLWRM